MSGNSGPKIQAAIRDARILELRVLGQTLEQIGGDALVQLAKSNVKKHLDRLLKRMAEDQGEQAQRLKALAYARLERLLAKAMLLGCSGNLKAMLQAQRLIMSQAQLMGYASPVKVAATDPTGEFASVPPGTYVLPSRPDATIEDWSGEARKVWEAQQQRVPPGRPPVPAAGLPGRRYPVRRCPRRREDRRAAGRRHHLRAQARALLPRPADSPDL